MNNIYQNNLYNNYDYVYPCVHTQECGKTRFVVESDLRPINEAIELITRCIQQSKCER
jgi:hypothetical protein